ncbi:PilW family protein [Variovorax sp. YR216]|uniref:PilW family protein n=1 Tax=Variovorax sp. YR216 TaxID=1882828 RepID=UPI00089835E5|nr:PilW family protein [Variovorax sp. YR216]SEA13497.1 type IV pilus assembly protein PilW [Variovorax sp. YR216]
MTRRPSQRGVTLIELMVAMALGLVLVLAASTAFLAGNKLFNTDSDVQAVQDSLRFARYVVQSLVRQAGYADYAPDQLTNGVGVIASNANLLADSSDPMDLNIAGASNTTVSGSDFGQNNSDRAGGNDSLMVRFFGRSEGGTRNADGSMIDCMGTRRAGPADMPSSGDRVLNIFHVKVARDGEPSLYCKTDAKSAAQPLVRGVEKFKVVYGYDGNGDGVPETWLDASAIAAKGAETGSAHAEWRKVVAVRVGIVVRSQRPNGDLKRVVGEDYRLFPLGLEFKDVSFAPPADGRFRSVATFTVMLRNVVRDPE